MIPRLCDVIACRARIRGGASASWTKKRYWLRAENRTTWLMASPRAPSRCGCAVEWCPGAGGGSTPSVSSVSGSNATGIGVSVIATWTSPRRETLTLALFPNDAPGAKAVCTRLNSPRQGSVANSW